MKDWRHTLLYILETLVKVERARPGDYGEFLEDEEKRAAITYWLMTIGDAADELPEDMLKQHPGVPWDRIRGFRNRAAHGYMSLRDDHIWGILEHGLEPVRIAIARLLIDLGGLPGIPEEWLCGADEPDNTKET